MKEFKSRYSNYSRLLTIGFCIVCICIILSSINLKPLFASILIPIVLLTGIYFYSQSIRKILIQKEEVIIFKNIGKIAISLNDIKDIKRILTPLPPMTFGSKGVFGFIGITMDGSYSFVKDRNKAILLQTNTKKFLVSCDDPDDFIATFRKHIA